MLFIFFQFSLLHQTGSPGDSIQKKHPFILHLQILIESLRYARWKCCGDSNELKNFCTLAQSLQLNWVGNKPWVSIRICKCQVIVNVKRKIESRQAPLLRWLLNGALGAVRKQLMWILGRRIPGSADKMCQVPKAGVCSTSWKKESGGPRVWPGRICITKDSCRAIVFCFKREELGLRGAVVGALIFTKSPLSHHWKMKGLDCIGGSQAWLHDKCHKHPVKDITDWAPV